MHLINFSPNTKAPERKEYLRGLLSSLLYISNLLRAPITPMYANIILDYRKTMHKKGQDLRRLLSLEQWNIFVIGQDGN